MTFAAFWTRHACVFFLQRLDVSTLRLAVVIATANELTETAFFVNQLTIAFWTETAFYFGRLFCCFGGFFGGFVHIAGVITIWITLAGNEAAAFAKFNHQFVVATFRAHFVDFFGSDLRAWNVFFFFDLLVKVFPEGFHHGLPFALAAGDFVQLVFEFGGEVVIHVLAKMLGEEFVDDVACVGWREAFLV